MIISPSKIQDMRLREKYLIETKCYLRLYRQKEKPYLLEVSKTFGEFCAYLKNRIETHDYSKEDEFYRRFPKFLPTKAP